MIIYFWSIAPSRHLLTLLVALKSIDVEVRFRYFFQSYRNRDSDWFSLSELNHVDSKLVSLSTALSELDSVDSVSNIHHITEGFLNNGPIKKIQNFFSLNNIPFYVVSEKIDSRSFIKFFIKSILYFFRIRSLGECFTLLLIGGGNMFFNRLGVSDSNIYKWGYFPSNLSQKQYLNTKKINFLYLGRFSEEKGIHFLLSNVDQILKFNTNSIFNFVGSGPLLDSVNSLYSSYPSNVKVFNSMPHVDAMLFLRDCDCLILPSYYDGWGMVISEALLIGVPVICSDMVGITNFLPNNHPGLFVYKSGDSSSFLNSIKLVSNLFNLSHSSLDPFYISSSSHKLLSSSSGASLLIKYVKQ